MLYLDQCLSPFFVKRRKFLDGLRNENMYYVLILRCLIWNLKKGKVEEIKEILTEYADIISDNVLNRLPPTRSINHVTWI